VSRPVLVLRPEPGCAETLAAARGRGLEAIAAPLFAIQPVAWTAPDASAFDALLVGSANAFRQGGSGLAAVIRLPVLAVGDRTADAARAAGFRVAATGQGGLQAVIETVEAPARLLRLSGETRVELVPPPGVEVVDATVYRAVPLPLADRAVAALRAGAVAMLHSAEAARRFAAECDRLGIARGTVRLAALASRIAEAAGEGWAQVCTAAQVTDCALLALATDMCH
jgi:uroporphyrinogen-III synthase